MMFTIKFRNFLFFLLPILILIAVFLSVKYFMDQGTIFVYAPNSSLTVYIDFANTHIKRITADEGNKTILTAKVRDNFSLPVKNVHVSFSVSSEYGKIVPMTSRTNEYGECIAYFIPNKSLNVRASGSKKVSVSANIKGTDVGASIEFEMVPVPVVFVHGYLATGTAFSNMKEYLSSKGVDCIIFEYKSTAGVKAAALELNAFLQKKKDDYLNNGILLNRFDIIAHSLGGIISRYYTSGDIYSKNSNVRKLILLAVPNHGSLLAPFAENYFSDQSITELSPQSTLFTRDFPSMINKGLNNTLEIGNIMIEYDEVVSPESASLEEWQINSEIFSIGENNLSVDKLFGGNINQLSNHKAVLNNKLVFDRILAMLDEKLQTPKILK